MVKHIVLWNFKEELTKAERMEAGLKMKEALEALKEIVPGTIDLTVEINQQDTSNRDIALISTFESVEALKGYIVHPAHVEAGQHVRAVTCDRACIDFEI